jgi:broad specificity phosphatase PhoE
VFDHSVIIIDRRLIERDLGTWTGMSKKEIQSKYSYAFTETGTMNFFYTPPGGEAYRDMIRRVADFLTDTYEREKDPIAIITHNGVFRVIKSLITGSPMGYVFTNSEPHLIPQTFTVDENIIKKVRNNCFYTVDLK